LYQKNNVIEQQVQQQLKQMQELGLNEGSAFPSSRVLAAASTPALHAALRSKASLPTPHVPDDHHPSTPLVSGSVSLQARGMSPSLSQARPHSSGTQASVSRLSVGNLWKASDSVTSGGKSRVAHSEVDSQIGFLEETLAREKLRRMAAESELAYLKEIVLSTRQQMSRPL
jgi:hypothetical protein